MLQIGERTNFIIALCSNLQILDSCPLLKSGTVLKFFIRGINEPAGRVVFFRNDRFSLMLHFDAVPDTLLCVFLTQRLRTATHKTFFIKRAEWDVFGSSFFKSFPFDFIPFGSHQKQKFFVSGSRLDAEIDVLSDLRFPCRTVLVRLPFFVFFATLRTRNDDGKIVFLAQLITQIPDVVIGLFAVVIFVMLDVISSTKYDVIMNMSFINVCGENIRIFPF